MTTLDDVESCLRSLKTCGICSSICTNPRTLECMHSYCLSCLQHRLQEAQDGATFDCPKCSLNIQTQSGQTVDNTYFERLGINSLFMGMFRNTNGALNENIIACKDHPGSNCKYYYTDTLKLACVECRAQNSGNCQKLDSEAFIKIRDALHKQLKTTVISTQSDIRELCLKLNEQKRDLLSKNDNMMLGILKYFADLKMKLLEYLTNHETEVLNKLNEFTTQEVKSVHCYRDQALAFLDTISNHFDFVGKSFKSTDQSNSLKAYVGLDHLSTHLADYKNKLTKIKRSVSDETEIRFIINTEFEDMLSGGDLINIELLNSNTRSSARARNALREEERSNVTDRPQSPPTISVSEPNEISDRTLQITNDTTPEETPPLYPGVTNESTNSTGRNDYRFPPSTSALQRPTNQSPAPSAPSFDELEAPNVPRQLTHGYQIDPITPPGTPYSAYEGPYNFEHLKSFSTRAHASEKSTIFGDLCWIDEEALLLIDKRNKRIKTFNSRGRFLNHFVLVDDAFGCTSFQTGQQVRSRYRIALTFPKIKAVIQFTVHTNNNYAITQERLLNTKKGYTCITYHEHTEQFICGTTTPFAMPSVDILQINESTNQISHTKTYTHYNGIQFGYPRYVRVNSEGVIALSDYKSSKVILIDLDGNCRGVFDGSYSRNIQDPQGIGLLDDNFLIADTRRNHLFIIDSKAAMIGEIREQFLKEKTPRFLDISKSRRPLLAIGHGNSQITTYKVNNQNWSEDEVNNQSWIEDETLICSRV